MSFRTRMPMTFATCSCRGINARMSKLLKPTQGTELYGTGTLENSGARGFNRTDKLRETARSERFDTIASNR